MPSSLASCFETHIYRLAYFTSSPCGRHVLKAVANLRIWHASQTNLAHSSGHSLATLFMSTLCKVGFGSCWELVQAQRCASNLSNINAALDWGTPSPSGLGHPVLVDPALVRCSPGLGSLGSCGTASSGTPCTCTSALQPWPWEPWELWHCFVWDTLYVSPQTLPLA